MNHFEALLLFEQFQESCSCNFQNSVGSLSRSLCLLPREEDHVGSALRNAACGRSDCCCPRPLLSLLELAPCQVLLKSSSFFSALLKGARLQGSCQPTPPPFLFPTPRKGEVFFFRDMERCKETDQLPLPRGENRSLGVLIFIHF